MFPRWRGLGHGNRLLRAIEALAMRTGISDLIVGADEDDWPLGWYQRRGYVTVDRVAKAVD